MGTGCTGFRQRAADDPSSALLRRHGMSEAEAVFPKDASDAYAVRGGSKVRALDERCCV